MLTVLPLRAAFAAEKLGKLVPYTHAMYRAYWAEGRDISDAAVVAGRGDEGRLRRRGPRGRGAEPTRRR